jgi:hypothetical protein
MIAVAEEPNSLPEISFGGCRTKRSTGVESDRRHTVVTSYGSGITLADSLA